MEGDKYYGAKATINVWEPKIQQPNEFSLSQLWILGGSFGEDLNSIEAGWQVSTMVVLLSTIVLPDFNFYVSAIHFNSYKWCMHVNVNRLAQISTVTIIQDFSPIGP